jgi:hypothetical protein
MPPRGEVLKRFLGFNLSICATQRIASLRQAQSAVRDHDLPSEAVRGYQYHDDLGGGRSIVVHLSKVLNFGEELKFCVSLSGRQLCFDNL